MFFERNARGRTKPGVNGETKEGPYCNYRCHADGHINETVECRNFRRRVQMPGESFDDFLISLRELAKTCRFCSEICAQKSIHDQVIEGLSDGDTIEDLLQISDLTLDTTISKCQSREAARKHRTDITAQGDTVAALRKSQTPHPAPQATCPGPTQGGPGAMSSL